MDCFKAMEQIEVCEHKCVNPSLPLPCDLMLDQSVRLAWLFGSHAHPLVPHLTGARIFFLPFPLQIELL